MPDLTIGLPVYNAEHYLSEALDSLLSQTYREFVLILSDNCSTDRTPDICRAYAEKDSRIRYIQNEHDLGASANYNRTFNQCETRYFKWAPCDDKVEPEFLARCIEELEAHPSAVLCYSRAKIIDERGEFVINHNPGPAATSLKPAERFRSLMMHPEYAIQQHGVVRADAMRHTVLHGSFPSGDETWLAELSLNGPFCEVQERLYLYRRHCNQSTRHPKRRDRMKHFDTALDGKIVLPTWLYFFAAVGAVHRASLRQIEKADCYFTMLRWAVRPDHFGALVKDMVLALAKLARRPFADGVPSAIEGRTGAYSRVEGGGTNVR